MRDSLQNPQREKDIFMGAGEREGRGREPNYSLVKP